MELVAHQSNLWYPFHLYPVQHAESWSPIEARRWYQQWLLKVQAMQDCKCRLHWDRYADDHEPDFESAHAFFHWGVEAHNWVNTNHANRPTVPIRAAIALWNAPKIWMLKPLSSGLVPK